MLAELEYALQLMEASSHSGLDDRTAEYLRSVLNRRIAEAEGAIALEASPAPLTGDDAVPE